MCTLCVVLSLIGCCVVAPSAAEAVQKQAEQQAVAAQTHATVSTTQHTQAHACAHGHSMSFHIISSATDSVSSMRMTHPSSFASHTQLSTCCIHSVVTSHACYPSPDAAAQQLHITHAVCHIIWCRLSVSYQLTRLSSHPSIKHDTPNIKTRWYVMSDARSDDEPVCCLIQVVDTR